MRFSCTDFSFPLLSHEAALDLVAAMGFEAVDLVVASGVGHVRPEAVADHPEGWAERLRERIGARGLAVSDVLLIQGSHHGDIPYNHPDPDRRERALELFEATLKMASGVGAGGITVLPGPRFEGEPAAASAERSAEALAELLVHAAETGLTLSAEPHLGAWAETPAGALELVERCPGLKLTVDYGHFVYQGIAAEEVDALLPHARHLHVRGGCPGRLQTTSRENTIDFARIVERLLTAGYGGDLATEFVWFQGEGPYSRCDEVDCVAESVRAREALAAAARDRG
ncbi:MAG: sugar phosphate isomerase/epimerase [Actinobacteria bacterium]|nr:sugar phosphate isomerase/epimerase [Actinomycetota bacterium]